mgnify:FL=1
MNEQYLELLVLKNLNQTISQKTIAKNIGHSVGKVNYIMKALIQNGLVKAENFATSTNKKQYQYLLTQDGIKHKIKITEEFIDRKKQEYDSLQEDLVNYRNIYKDVLNV